MTRKRRRPRGAKAGGLRLEGSGRLPTSGTKRRFRRSPKASQSESSELQTFFFRRTFIDMPLSSPIRYGARWVDILNDPVIGHALRARTNIQLKDRARIEKKHAIARDGDPGIWHIATN